MIYSLLILVVLMLLLLYVISGIDNPKMATMDEYHCFLTKVNLNFLHNEEERIWGLIRNYNSGEHGLLTASEAEIIKRQLLEKVDMIRARIIVLNRVLENKNRNERVP